MKVSRFSNKMSHGGLALGIRILWLLAFSLITLPASGHSQTISIKPENNHNTEEENTKNNTKENSGFIANVAGTFLKEHQIALIGQPHTINILPIAYFDFHSGINLGCRALLLSRQTNPYLYRLTLQLITSSKWSHNHKIIFEYPEIKGSKFGFMVHSEWRRDLQARYFGLGNNSLHEDKLTDSDSDEFIHEDYYIYNLKRPRITLYGTFNLLPDIRFWFGYGLQSVEPQLKNGPETSFIATDRPFGYSGGSGHHFNFRLSWDTRTNDVYPLDGFFTEFSLEPNFATVNEEFQKSNGVEKRSKKVTFYRHTFSNASFFSFKSDRLILANRFAFEAITGEAPYYALGEIAGQRYTRGLGGSQSLRGFQSRRFQDKIKFFTMTELRYQFKKFIFLKQTFDLIFIGFIDNGRVWRRWSEISFNNFHSAFGIGVWFNWNQDLILRLDIGKSKEGIVPYFRINTAF